MRENSNEENGKREGEDVGAVLAHRLNISRDIRLLHLHAMHADQEMVDHSVLWPVASVLNRSIRQPCCQHVSIVSINRSRPELSRPPSALWLAQAYCLRPPATMSGPAIA